MRAPAYPSLSQSNTRVWLTGRSRALGRPTLLDDDAALEKLQESGGGNK